MKAVIYARVSSKDQEDGHSLDAQIQSGFKYAIEKDFNVLEQFKIVERSTANVDGEKLVFTLQKPFDKLIEMTSLPSWLPSFNIFRNKQDDILSTMNRPMMEGVKLCLAA